MLSRKQLGHKEEGLSKKDTCSLCRRDALVRHTGMCFLFKAQASRFSRHVLYLPAEEKGPAGLTALYLTPVVSEDDHRLRAQCCAGLAGCVPPQPEALPCGRAA